jgi:uncharacterized membrane protein YqjE
MARTVQSLLRQEMAMNHTQPSDQGTTSSLGDVMRRIGDDVKTIAGDELQLAKIELTRAMKVAAGDAAAIVLGGIVALIGFGMLCVTAVIALEPVIPQLWLRMIIMAVVYLVAGGAVAGIFVRKLKEDANPAGSDTVEEARATVENIKRGLSAGRPHHVAK